MTFYVQERLTVNLKHGRLLPKTALDAVVALTPVQRIPLASTWPDIADSYVLVYPPRGLCEIIQVMRYSLL